MSLNIPVLCGALLLLSWGVINSLCRGVVGIRRERMSVRGTIVTGTKAKVCGVISIVYSPAFLVGVVLDARFLIIELSK